MAIRGSFETFLLLIRIYKRAHRDMMVAGSMMVLVGIIYSYETGVPHST